MRPSHCLRWLNVSLTAVILVGMVSCSDDSAPPGAVPAAITNVTPPDGSVVASAPNISVAFDLQRDGGVDPDSVRLAVDGRDVTDRARGAGTDDSPQSRGELIYEPEQAMSDGVHRAEVQYRGGGQIHRYAWEFTVRA